jgi:hypothetical protein
MDRPNPNDPLRDPMFWLCFAAVSALATLLAALARSAGLN